MTHTLLSHNTHTQYTHLHNKDYYKISHTITHTHIKRHKNTNTHKTKKLRQNKHEQDEKNTQRKGLRSHQRRSQAISLLIPENKNNVY